MSKDKTKQRQESMAPFQMNLEDPRVRKVVGEKVYRFISGTFNVESVFLNTRRSDDELYKNSKELQHHIPRGLFCVKDGSGEIITISHGCHKFTGQEDEGTMQLFLSPGFRKLNQANKVFITEKINGKFMTLKFFKYLDSLYCILTSKTVPFVFLVDNLDTDIKIDADGFIPEIYNSLKTMWSQLSQTTKKSLINLCLSGYTFQCEYMDGKHMVPLNDGEEPFIVFTTMIKCDQTGDCSKSYIVSHVNGELLYPYLLRFGLPKKNVARFLFDDVSNFMRYKKELNHKNLFEEGVPTEGVVVYYLTDDNRVVALRKVKNYEYVLLRMLREHLKKLKFDGMTTHSKSIRELLDRRCTGSNAYPKIDQEHLEEYKQKFIKFDRWLVRTFTSQQIMRDIKDFKNGLGIGELWKRFCNSSELPEQPDTTSVKGVVTVSNPKMIKSVSKSLQQNGFMAGKKNSPVKVKYNHKDTSQSFYNVDRDKLFDWNESDDLISQLTDWCTKKSINDTADEEENTMEIENEFMRFFKKLYEDKVFEQSREYVEKVCNRRITIRNYGSSRLILLRGIPGSGKTTIARVLEKLLDNADTIASDDFKALYKNGKFNPMMLRFSHPWCQKKTMMMLSQGKTVIVHNTQITLQEILPYAQMLDNGFTVIQIEYIDKKEENYTNSTHGVPVKKCKDKETILENTNLPEKFEDFFRTIPIGCKKNPITILAVKGEQLFVPGMALHGDFPPSHYIFHVTLKYKEDVSDEWGGLGTQYQIHGTEIIERVEKKRILRCMKVYIDELKKPYHITLIAKGFKPVQSNELLEENPKLEPTKRYSCDIKTVGYVNFLNG